MKYSPIVVGVALLAACLGVASDNGPAKSPAPAAAPPATRPPREPVARQKAGSPLLDRLQWLAGAWVGDEGQPVAQQWMEPAGGMMLGMHRTITPTGSASFEYMRIVGTPGGLFYFSSPGGQAATRFDLVESGESSVTFENPKHEFPRRVRYWREGDDLHARFEGVRLGKDLQQDWKLKRQIR